MCANLGGVGDERVHQEGMLLKLVFVPERIDSRSVSGATELWCPHLQTGDKSLYSVGQVCSPELKWSTL